MAEKREQPIACPKQLGSHWVRDKKMMAPMPGDDPEGPNHQHPNPHYDLMSNILNRSVRNNV